LDGWQGVECCLEGKIAETNQRYLTIVQYRQHFLIIELDNVL
jgi:hypothetical protein